KTPIKVGRTALIPWKDIPSVGPAVSGVGTYTTTFELPADWSDNNGAYLDIESLCRNTAYVWVNGQRATGLDFVTGNIDVSELLQPGVNTIKIEVSSTLRNRLVDLKYPGMNPNSTYTPEDYPLADRPAIRIPAADYGMTGEVTLETYTKVAAVNKEDEPSSSESENPSSSNPDGSSSSSPSESLPKTGANDMVFIMAVLMLAAGAAVVFCRRKAK
ncbi:MAG: LPXTG cell wall anchor domain-containing protein, partial [Massilioclostridium sp.]|nr:LPXTG cell wall anchor domain-containing protein [Massilioclostridium sp.]